MGILVLEIRNEPTVFLIISLEILSRDSHQRCHVRMPNYSNIVLGHITYAGIFYTVVMIVSNSVLKRQIWDTYIT